MPAQPHRPGRATALALLALVLTACGTDAPGGEPALAAVPTPASAAGLRLPLQEYIPGPDQLALLNRAQWILTDQCMSRYGFHNRAPRPPEGTASRGEPDRRYGLTDPEAAAASGYGAEEAEAPRKEPMPSMDPAESLVFGGGGRVDPKAIPQTQAEAEKAGGGAELNGLKVPVGGCNREGYLKLWRPGADSRDPMRAQELDAEAFGRSRQDSRVVKATEAWTRCMAGRGYRAANPVSPQTELGLVPAAFTSPQGVAAATADVACKRESNLVGIWFAVESAYQSRLIERNGELLTAVRRQREEAVRLAASLVSDAH
ncbi:hypothetical protein [Kitasatospora camelliae]|uniref:PknH-like protein n=1 Tax=Kitasatospora camelliae TaxID=3156397 RepID=A0AAU8K377_9ACTN